MSPLPRVHLDGRPLDLADVVAVARGSAEPHLAEPARAAVADARAIVERVAGGVAPTYGVNTGFGSLSRVRIEPAGIRAVQLNLVRSHASGVLEPLPEDVVRAMLLLLAGSLARGASGVRAAVIEAILALLRAGVTPVVPSRGSVGASGDLAPLAHASLVLVGEGEALVDGVRMPGGEALRARGLAPIELEAKEGLALINGTHLMAALGALVHADAARVAHAAVVAAAMAIDACRASDAPLDAELHRLRGQRGQAEAAAQLRALLAGSTIIPAHREDDPRVQDPYGLRAAPQVMGAALDLLAWSRTMTERELGAVTDNPLVLRGPDRIVSGGNFHGMPIALALDVVPTALATLAGIAERRVYWVLSAVDPQNPVHPYLARDPGLHSGLMITQYAAAACCNELQSLCGAATVANIPTSAGIEDYNSFGPTAGHQARRAVELAARVVAIELLVMAEAIEYQRPLRSGDGVERAHAIVRGLVPRLEHDRPPAPDIEALAQAILAGRFDAAT